MIDGLFATHEDKNRFLAATEMVRSTGVAGLEVRHSPEDEPPVIWSVVASWFIDGHGRPCSEEKARAARPLKPPRTSYEVGSSMVGPIVALQRLCEEIIDHGKCAKCRRPSVLDWTGHDLDGATMTTLDETGVDSDPLCVIGWVPAGRAQLRGGFVRACDGKAYRAGSGA